MQCQLQMADNLSHLYFARRPIRFIGITHIKPYRSCLIGIARLIIRILKFLGFLQIKMIGNQFVDLIDYF